MFKSCSNKPFFMNPDRDSAGCKDDNSIREDELIYLWKQIIYALADLQKARICHRDIRPDNIAIIKLDPSEVQDNRKTDYTVSHGESKQAGYPRLMRETTYSNYDRNTNSDSIGVSSGRGRSA